MRGGGVHIDSSGASHARAFVLVNFDSRFYEGRALRFYAATRRTKVRAQVRLPRLDVPWSRRPEVDGIALDEGRERAIEVKAYPLEARELDAIFARYASLGFSKVTVIAPSFERARPAAGGDREAVTFVPDLASVRAHYDGAWRGSGDVDAWLAGGGIHVRVTVAEAPRHGGRRTLNQVDKNPRSTGAVQRELRRRVIPSWTPARLHWTPFRSMFPKDAYFRERRRYLLACPLAFDVDGPLIHGSMFPCTIDPELGLCVDCVMLARRHTLRLVALLRERGFAPSVFFSGAHGFHVYVFRHFTTEERMALTREALARRIALDLQVATAELPLLAFPTSVHGITSRPLVDATKLDAFRLEQAPPVGPA